MTLGIYFQAVPWAIPTWLVGTLVVVVLSHRLARRAGWSRWEVVALGTSVVGFLAVTTTPNPGTWRGMGAGRHLDLAPYVLDPRDLGTLALEPVLNVWLAVPMGAVATYVALRRDRRWPVTLVLAVPVLAELVQLAFPPLGRSAFLLGDVLANWQGVVLGSLPGALAALLVHRSARRLRAR